MTNLRKLPGWVSGVIGVTAVIAAWWIIAAVGGANAGDGVVYPIPTPLAVVTQLFTDGPAFYSGHIAVTLREASVGFLWGNGLALILTFLVLLLPRIEKVALQVAVITYCVPIVAIGPIVQVVLGPPPSGQPSDTATVLAALSVFFTTVVGSLVGLKAADAASLDVITVYGGGKFTQLRKVRIIAALPAVLNALKIAAPAALLGAVLGEFFGQVERGLGLAMVAAGSASQSARVWGIALVCALVAGLGYALFGLISRYATPWTSGRSV